MDSPIFITQRRYEPPRIVRRRSSSLIGVVNMSVVRRLNFENEFKTIFYAHLFGSLTFPTEISCPICYVDFNANMKVVKTNCNHIFCETCLTKWKEEKKTTCPLCRTDILQDAYVIVIDE